MFVDCNVNHFFLILKNVGKLYFRINFFELMTDYEPDLRLEVLITVAQHISKALHLKINLCREVRD